MLPVIISDDALEDLAQIQTYFLQFSSKTSERVIAGLFRAFDLLAKYPQAGHHRPDLTARLLLFWTENRKMIVYHPNSMRLEIIRIIDSYRDIKHLL